MKNLPQLLDCYLLKILPQGFHFEWYESQLQSQTEKKKAQNLKMQHVY